MYVHCNAHRVMRPLNGSFQNVSLSLSHVQLNNEKRKGQGGEKSRRNCSVRANHSGNETPRGTEKILGQEAKSMQTMIPQPPLNLTEAC